MAAWALLYPELCLDLTCSSLTWNLQPTLGREADWTRSSLPQVMLDVSSLTENMKLLHGKTLVLSVQEQKCPNHCCFRALPLPGHVLLLHAEKSHRFQSLLSARTGHPLTLVQDGIPSQS